MLAPAFQRALMGARNVGGIDDNSNFFYNNKLFLYKRQNYRTKLKICKEQLLRRKNL